MATRTFQAMARLGSRRGQIAFDSLQAFAGAADNLLVQPLHDLAKGGFECVILAFRNQVRSRDDQLHADREGRAFLKAAFHADIGFFDLQARLQSEDSVFDKRVQFVTGSHVMVL
jgi:hypothetical protein